MGIPSHAPALVCACGAVVLGVRQLARSLRASAASQARGFGRRYDSSRFGRRLETRLWAAQIRMSPAGWRSGQLLLVVSVATTLVAAGIGGIAAATGAFSLVRIGGRMVLRARRRRGRDALDAAVPHIARSLATELSAWGSGTLAVSGAARRCADTPAASRLLDIAAARVALGGEPGPSLRRALDQVEPGLPSRSPAGILPAILGLHRVDAAAAAASLDRLAAALDDDRAVRREARARVGEVRMSAIAVPLIAAVSGAMLLSSDPPALAASLSFPLFPVLLCLIVVIVGAAALARRLVAM